MEELLLDSNFQVAII